MNTTAEVPTGRGIKLGRGWRLDWPRGPERIAMFIIGAALVAYAVLR
jgi:hypothetical protein